MKAHLDEHLKLIALIPLLLYSGCNFFEGASELVTDTSAGFNGSFEVTREGVPVNWYIYRPTIDSSQARIVFDTILPYDGKQSLKFIIDSCSSVGGWHSPGIFNEMDVDTGSVYRVSCWIKNQGCRYMLRMDGFVFGNPKAPKETKWISFDADIDEWKQFEYTFTFIEGRNRFRFELNILSPGILWIDDIRIEKQ